jgi:predicted GTPase
MALGHDSARLQRALEAARRVLDGLRDFGEDFAVQRQEVAQAIESASSENLLIVVVGSAKRGKSTLINGILGRRDDTLAPVGKFPATNVVSVFRHSTTPKVEVQFEEGLGSRQITENEIREYACEDRNPSNEKMVAVIDVFGPFAGIDPRTILADLPGADNAQGAQHTQTLFGFLPRADAIIFLTTADEPINAAEQALLKHIKGLGLKADSVMFVVNKKDYVNLGELDPDELSQAIAHNRKIIESAGFPNPNIHAISAKDYLEGKPDSGVEGLLAAMQRLVEHERIEVMASRLESRLRIVFAQVCEQTSKKLELAKSTSEQLEERRGELVALKRGLDRGRHARQAEFVKEWRGALNDLCGAADRIEGELRDRYGSIVDRTSASDLKPLLQTIHSDVYLAVTERMRPELSRCNARLEQAQLALVESVGIRPMELGAAETSLKPATGSFEGLKGALKIASAGLPATATGVGLLAAPGIVGAIIASAAPSVALTLNPLTWITGLLALPGAAAVTVAQSGAVVALGTIAAPLSMVAIGYAGYRSYRMAKSLQLQDRNKLKAAVSEMVQGMCGQVKEDARCRLEQGDEIVAKFHAIMSDQIDASESELERLVRERPTDAQLLKLEQTVKQARALEAALEPGQSGQDRGGEGRTPWRPDRGS